jgi:hypothetical protein
MGGAFGGMGMSHFVRPAVAEQLKAADKRVLVFFLAGGVSQLETWDPKPGTDTGGPFRAIPTSVPGIHISELLPHTAKQMHRLALVRSINTAEDDHGKGHYYMETGRRESPALRYPTLGSAAAYLLSPKENALPGYIHVQPGGSGFGKQDAAFLGPRFASVGLGGGLPAEIHRPDGQREATDQARHDLRRRVNERFLKRRRTADTEAYTQSYDQALELMKRKELFDVARLPEKQRERYGGHDFGRHCLLAKQLLEAGVTCVKVTHTNYDTHSENFDFHLEQLGEFDRPFATILQDLDESGLLANTLVIVMSEFGRTPNINHLMGRDHWSRSWSIALGGAGVRRGVVIGKTNANGTEVTDRQVTAEHLWHTYIRALDLDPKAEYELPGDAIAVAQPGYDAIREVLA